MNCPSDLFPGVTVEGEKRHRARQAWGGNDGVVTDCDSSSVTGKQRKNKGQSWANDTMTFDFDKRRYERESDLYNRNRAALRMTNDLSGGFVETKRHAVTARSPGGWFQGKGSTP